ncbi:MAG: hypothetical protein P0Y55_12145 [Candidatus Cohnella colombiensis]|uniref:Uncharacterized protein n=1 Tax=Candidatus Cohnella colombiensis TaxID=3121368 RepID=A0AA95JF47_9BACL|nr:MAG: hypothetical protein P0Y55_12145 [Cohnella sp.]
MAFDNNTALTFAENDVPETGVAVSTSFGTRQSIYADRSYLVAMQQIITAEEDIPVQYNYGMKQSIYSDVQTIAGMRLSIYADRSYSYPLKLSLYGPRVIISMVSLRGSIPTVNYQNFEMFAGDSIQIEVAVTDKGEAVYLTGTTIKWALKRSVLKTANVALKTTASGIELTDPTDGKFQVTLNAIDTVSLKPGYYYHEAEITDASGNVSTIMTGTVAIVASGV